MFMRSSMLIAVTSGTSVRCESANKFAVQQNTITPTTKLRSAEVIVLWVVDNILNSFLASQFSISGPVTSKWLLPNDSKKRGICERVRTLQVLEKTIDLLFCALLA